MSLDDRHRTRAPAFIGGRKFRRAAECEGRHDIHRERRGVVVIDEEDDIRLRLCHPLLGFLETREHAFPVRFLSLFVVDRCADRRHMRGRYSCDDPSHVSTSICCAISPWIWPTCRLCPACPAPICCDCLLLNGPRRASYWRSPPDSILSYLRRDGGTNGHPWRQAWR